MSNSIEENLILAVKKRLHVVVMSALILGIIAFSISNLLTPEYKTSVDLLVIQKQQADKVDAFGAAKSAEYLSSILEKAVYSSTFYYEILDDIDGISKGDLGENEVEIEKKWKKQVIAKSDGDTGILNISVFYENKDISEDLASTVSNRLIEDGQLYHGGGDQVEIKVINGPITKDNPVRPNIWINTILGLMVGIFASSSLIVITTLKNTDTEQKEALTEIFNRNPANFA